MAEEIIDNGKKEKEEKEVDLLELASTLWKNRRRLIKWSACGLLIGLVVAFSLPKEYSVSVKLAPEINDRKSMTGNLGALASMAGLTTRSSSGADAVYPMLYPDVVNSVPFITSLFDVEVETGKDGEKMTVRQFMEEETKGPWWGAVLGLPGKIIGLFSSSSSEEPADHQLDNFKLTNKENRLFQALSHRIDASVDQKTSVVTISVKMQNPVVSAMLADTVVSRLKTFITEYRTDKARQDLAYAIKLNEEAKENYYAVQQRYADYLDRNQGMVLHSARTTRERLENEATLAFNLYNQTAQKVQNAQAKVQETTPVYAVLNPPSVPLKPSSPRKLLILIGWTFLAFVACATWILFLSPKLKSFKNRKQEE